MTAEPGEAKIELAVQQYWNSKKTPATKGDEIKGVLIRMEADEYKGRATTRGILQGKAGMITLPNHTILNNMMLRVPIGRTVRIVYVGKGEASRGRAAPELYEVYMTSDPIVQIVQKSPQMPPESPIVDIEGKVLADMRKADGWEYGTFSELVMKHVNGDIGESLRLVDKLKNSGKISQYQSGNKAMWKAT